MLYGNRFECFYELGKKAMLLQRRARPPIHRHMQLLKPGCLWRSKGGGACL